MASWRNPAEGYNTFGSSQSDLLQTKQTYDDIILVAESANRTIAAAWDAPASTVMQSRLRAYRDTLPEIQNVLLNARTAVVSYKTALDDISSAQEGWLTQYNNATHRLNNFHPRNPLTDPEGSAEDALELVRLRARQGEALLRLQQLYSRRREADAELIAALNNATPRTWADTCSGFAAAGITQEMLLSSSKSKEAMLDLAQRMTDGDMSDENMAALSGLLSVWGNSQTTMSSFFARFGGANTAQLIDQLAERMSYQAGVSGDFTDHDIEIRTLAERLRAGLRVGAQDWGQDFANGFMNDMLTGNPEYWDGRAENGKRPSHSARAQAVSFFFSDPEGTPMPENLALGAAFAVDQVERLMGDIHLVDFAPNESGIGANVFSMDGWAENGEYLGDTSFKDLPGRVFETLGLYPDSALEFLTSDGDRIAYWFGERNWTLGDGFAGPGALWLGAAQVEGAASSTVASEIMWELFGNEHFTSENVTDEGSLKLAGAVGADLAGLAEYIASHSGEAIVSFGTGTVELFGKDSGTHAPVVSAEILAKMLGVVAAHDGGSILLQGHAEKLQSAYFAYGITHPESFESAMRQADLLQAAIDGSGIGERVAAAERSDERREELIENISTLIGFVPIPGAGSLVRVGGGLIDYAQELIIDLGSDSLTDYYLSSSSEFAAALAQGNSDGISAAARMDSINAFNVYLLLQTDASQDALRVAGVDISSMGNPPTHSQAEMQVWIKANSDTLDDAAQVVLGRPDFSINDARVDYENASGNYKQLVALV